MTINESGGELGQQIRKPETEIPVNSHDTIPATELRDYPMPNGLELPFEEVNEKKSHRLLLTIGGTIGALALFAGGVLYATSKQESSQANVPASSIPGNGLPNNSSVDSPETTLPSSDKTRFGQIINYSLKPDNLGEVKLEGSISILVDAKTDRQNSINFDKLRGAINNGELVPVLEDACVSKNALFTTKQGDSIIARTFLVNPIVYTENGVRTYLINDPDGKIRRWGVNNELYNSTDGGKVKFKVDAKEGEGVVDSVVTPFTSQLQDTNWPGKFGYIVSSTDDKVSGAVTIVDSEGFFDDDNKRQQVCDDLLAIAKS